MHLIMIFATKGGVGKTTLSIWLGGVFGTEAKTLLVEMDRNFSLSTLLNINTKEVDTLYDVVHGEHLYNFYSKLKLDVLPADGRIFKLENELAEGKISLDYLWDTMEKYEYVVVDSHNSFTPLIVSLFNKASVIVIPFTPDKASLGAYFHTDKILREITKDNIDLVQKGVANRVKKGLFGFSKEDMKLVNIARRKTITFTTIIPESKLRGEPVFSDKSLTKYVMNLGDEIKEVM